MNRVSEFLREPCLNDIDIDGAERLTQHQLILERKPMLRAVFAEFHKQFRQLDARFLIGKGLSVEVGAGINMMRNSFPDVLATDIVDAPHLDKVINAEAMDFADNSVRVIYGQNCFHHFPHPDLFFDELDRVLSLGGGAIFLEPFYGPVAAFVFKRLFSSEGFDRHSLSWETPSFGPMSGANQALSYIIFNRDREEFTQKHPSLAIVHTQLAGNYLQYLLSGGLNFRPLCPWFFSPIVKALEILLSPLNRLLALHYFIVLRKIPV